MLTGKGMWIWEVNKAESSADKLVALARAAGLEHVLIKLTDGEYDYPIPAKDPSGVNERLTHDAIVALRGAGITVWGWGFAYGSGVNMEMQAHRLAGRVRQFGLDGVVINAEDFGARMWSSTGGADRARRYMETLKNDLAHVEGGVLTALSSYRFISAHGNFPFAAFMETCEIAMPQVYWVARGSGDALRNLQDSYNEYHTAFPTKLYIPTGAAYGEVYGTGRNAFFWSATPEQITIFLNQAQAMGLPAVNFWSWQHARHDHDNIWYSGTTLWDTIAAYPYSVSAPDTSSGSGSGSGSGAPSGETSTPTTIEVHVGEPGHYDGVYIGMPNASFSAFVRGGRKMKYAKTSATSSGVWSAWLPQIKESGQYAIEVWVPGLHATTEKARYFIQGVVGHPSAISVELNQQRFYDAWVALGLYKLDANNPQSGRVDLNNLTGEANAEIAFAGMRWRPATSLEDTGSTSSTTGESGTRIADGFDAPVGTLEERRGTQLWPGTWFDATGFARRYTDSGGSAAYHTGADLNLNSPQWNTDAGLPVYAIASGEVTFAGSKNVWNNIVIIRHDPLKPGGSYVYSRSAHLARMTVQVGDRVQRGDQIGTIGKPSGGTEHLHFDISPTEALFNNAGDWPRLDLTRLRRDYVDPKTFILQNRPR
jgi:murein DD-endopeptidase MepM/ murein hydrolase activator NlpD